MASKNISITIEVYEMLVKIKKEKESFSELFLRLLNIQRTTLDKTFGSWDLSEGEKTDIWGDLINRSGRKWTKPSLEVGKK